MNEIKQTIEAFFQLKLQDLVQLKDAREWFDRFITLLDQGKARAAEKIDGTWQVNGWVKKGILVGFRLGELEEMKLNGFPFYDKGTYPIKDIQLQDNVRIVPGGTSIRKGCFVATGVILMPPCYVNVGAYVDEGTMLDSHSLVGSCAQIGKNCHISAAAQIGGVLEPINANPVIIEDNVIVGGNCGIYEGVRIEANAILASGVILTSSTRVFDLVHQKVIGDKNSSVVIPKNAVVVPGSRPATGSFAEKNQIHLYTPVIVKYRDEKSDAKTALEEALRKI